VTVNSHQRPAKTKGFRLADELTQPFNEIIPVLIISENSTALDSGYDYMMQGIESIHACLAWPNALSSSSGQLFESYYFMGVPKFPPPPKVTV
jgi:hypothetical protein